MTKIEEIESRKNLELNKQDKFILQLHQELIRERQIINNKNEEIERLKMIITKERREFDVEQKLHLKENIIKEVRECIEKHIKDKKYLNNMYSDKDMLEIVLEILDKGE